MSHKSIRLELQAAGFALYAVSYDSVEVLNGFAVKHDVGYSSNGSTEGRAPHLPDGLRDHAAAFWASRVTGAVDLDVDGEALRHWILCIDEREKLRAATVRAPRVKGSHAQLLLNPHFRHLRDLTRETARAEEHFGMTPLARPRLGVTFLQEQTAKGALAAKRERRPHVILS